MQTFIKYFKDTTVTVWAKSTLTPEEQSQFHTALTDNNNLWQSYYDRGLCSVRDVYTTVYSTVLNSNIEMLVGQEFIPAAGVAFDDLTVAPNWVYWLTRYNVDTGGDELVPLVQ